MSNEADVFAGAPDEVRELAEAEGGDVQAVWRRLRSPANLLMLAEKHGVPRGTLLEIALGCLGSLTGLRPSDAVARAIAALRAWNAAEPPIAAHVAAIKAAADELYEEVAQADAQARIAAEIDASAFLGNRIAPGKRRVLAVPLAVDGLCHAYEQPGAAAMAVGIVTPFLLEAEVDDWLRQIRNQLPPETVFRQKQH